MNLARTLAFSGSPTLKLRLCSACFMQHWTESHLVQARVQTTRNHIKWHRHMQQHQKMSPFVDVVLKSKTWLLRSFMIDHYLWCDSVDCCVCEEAGSECRWTLQRRTTSPGCWNDCVLVLGPVRQESGGFDSMHRFAFKLSTHGSNWRTDAIVPNPFHPNIVVFCDARSCLCTVWESVHRG